MSYTQNNPLSRKNSPLNKDDQWIQKATADIKKRGTEGVCTGDKFGSESCPPGSKRYNLAKTFKAMAKKRGPSRESSEEEYMPIEDDMHKKGEGDMGMSRKPYGGNKGDEKRSVKDYEGPSRKSSSPLNNTGMTGLNYSKELEYMPIEDDMNRGMSRESSSPLDYGSWAHEDATRAKDLYKKGDYAHARALGIDEHDADYGKWRSSEAEHGPSRKSRSERLRDRAMKRSERSGAEWGDYDYEDKRVQKMLSKASELDERSGRPKVKPMKMQMIKNIKPLPKKKA